MRVVINHYGNDTLNVLAECMAFSKCSNLKTLYTSNFASKELKGRTITSDKQILETNLFRWILCI